MDVIDVNKIMQEIREEIAQKHIITNDLKFEDLESDILLGDEECKLYLDGINNGYIIEAYRPIRSRKGLLGKTIIFLKKILRKTIKFYIEPIAKDQTDFNANVVQILNINNKLINEQNRKIIKLEKEILSLKKRPEK